MFELEILLLKVEEAYYSYIRQTIGWKYDTHILLKMAKHGLEQDLRKQSVPVLIEKLKQNVLNYKKDESLGERIACLGAVDLQSNTIQKK